VAEDKIIFAGWDIDYLAGDHLTIGATDTGIKCLDENLAGLSLRIRQIGEFNLVGTLPQQYCLHSNFPHIGADESRSAIFISKYITIAP
jgi:hypothetical protein